MRFLTKNGADPDQILDDAIKAADVNDFAKQINDFPGAGVARSMLDHNSEFIADLNEVRTMSGRPLFTPLVGGAEPED